MSQFLGFAIFLTVVGGLMLHAGGELPWFVAWVGKLPGDIVIRKGSVTFYLPLTSSLVVSAVLSAVLSVFSKRG